MAGKSFTQRERFSSIYLPDRMLSGPNYSESENFLSPNYCKLPVESDSNSKVFNFFFKIGKGGKLVVELI